MSYTPPTALISTGIGYTYTGYTNKLIDVAHDGVKLDLKECTHQGSNLIKDFLAGLQDNGTLTLTTEFLPGTTIPVKTSGTLTITWNGHGVWSCQAICSGYKFANAKLGERMTVDVDFKVCGDLTTSAGS